MSSTKRTVLITGCSDDSLGAALAIAFHKAGLHVYATARNVDKLRQVKEHGIETLQLDVLSDSSIAECVGKVSSLDILVNNAGGGYAMPVTDVSISEAKKLFDLNVWSYIAVTQAFLPLIIKSKGMIVNQTSVAGVVAVPFQTTYNASKAAMSMFSDGLRLELQPFDVVVVDLKTGGVKSQFGANITANYGAALPKTSIYEPAREMMEKILRGEVMDANGEPADVYATNVVQDLLKKKPPTNIWRGASAGLARISTVLPHGMFDAKVKKLTGMDVVERLIRERRK
jgi:1-acylglycerone phosphate reductase